MSGNLGRFLKLAALGLAATGAYQYFNSAHESSSDCENPDKQIPAITLPYHDEEFRKEMLEKFQGALQIPTVSMEEFAEDDSRWEVFYQFHEYLEKAFPLVHKHLEKTVINKYSLLFEWKGTDESKLPIMFMAHQDVVPVVNETLDQWNYPPYSGHYDGHFIWARGVADDKQPLISSLEAIELLLREGYQPQRGVLLAFGHDEEIGGHFGATEISKHLQETRGSNSVHSIIDEGGLGLLRVQGMNSAIVAVGEKGRYAAEITLYANGGHSSSPPKNTGIGIMGKLASLIEDTPYEATLTPRNPFVRFLHCVAKYSETHSAFTRKFLQRVGTNSLVTKMFLKKFIKDSPPELAYMVQTSQAIDVINGGVKINALPEVTSMQVDSRIAPEFSVQDVEDKWIDNVKQIAKQFDLGLVVNNETLIQGKQYFEFRGVSARLEPSPVSQTYGSPEWAAFAGSIRYVYENLGGPVTDFISKEKPTFDVDNNIVVAPSIMTGNTDTRHYWNLTGNIYRFTPIRVEEHPNLHTVNEHISLENHLEGIALYHAYIQNAQ